MKHRIAVIAGDGIGQEVMPEALRAIDAVQRRFGFALQQTPIAWASCDYYARTGQMMPDDWKAQLQGMDALLFGAVGWPATVPDHVSLWGSLIPFRRGFDQYVNLRPCRLMPGIATPLANRKPGDIDFVVVREGTEGLYCGAGGAVRRGTPNEVATEVSINTAFGVERVVRYAFQLAMKRKKHVTLVHKKNVLVNAGDMWQRIVDKVGEEFPQVTHDYLHIDATTIFLVSNPSRFDVILTDNLFGDILTDEAGAVVGGVGYSASGNINASNEYPSMFEPIHGSAPDIAGKGIANPTAAVLSSAMLLRHLGFDEAAAKIDRAVEADIAELGSTKRTTEEVGRDILARI